MDVIRKITVTGSSGFIGSRLCSHLVKAGYHVTGTVRAQGSSKYGVKIVAVGELDNNTDWSDALHAGGVVVHLAGRVHILKDQSANPMSEFRTANVAATVNLAKQSLEKGVSRFIYISSIAVNGSTSRGQRISVHSPEAPQSPYAISKFEAELELKKLLVDKKMELVIIRPPAVYGREAPGNFRLLSTAIKRRLPLPLGNIHNKRSLIAVQNLVSFIEACIGSAVLRSEIFIVDDAVDLSTPEIIRLLASFYDKEPSVISVPVWIVRLVFRVLGRNDASRSLLGDFQLDSSYARNTLNWSPPFDPRKIINVASDNQC